MSLMIEVPGRLSASRAIERGRSLWGYCAEILLKAASFSVIDVGERTPLQMAVHIIPAIQLGRGLGIAWQVGGQGHHVRAWAELLVLERATHPDPAVGYSVEFGDRVQAHALRISQPPKEWRRGCCPISLFPLTARAIR